MTSNNNVPPIVLIAALCHDVVEDKRDGTLSIIRILDQVTITRMATLGRQNPLLQGVSAPYTLGQMAEERMPPTPVNLVAVIGTLAGEARGERTLSINVIAPDGTTSAIAFPQPMRVFYDGPLAVRNCIVRLGLTANDPGQFWLEALFDGQVVTRVPLRIAYEPNSTGGGLP